MCYVQAGHRHQLYNNEYDLIAIVGCLSHPKAREYLMAPVIAELERLESLHDINKTDDKEEIGLSIAYGVAISLIRNGCDNK